LPFFFVRYSFPGRFALVVFDFSTLVRALSAPPFFRVSMTYFVVSLSTLLFFFLMKGVPVPVYPPRLLTRWRPATPRRSQTPLPAFFHLAAFKSDSSCFWYRSFLPPYAKKMLLSRFDFPLFSCQYFALCPSRRNDFHLFSPFPLLSFR